MDTLEHTDKERRPRPFWEFVRSVLIAVLIVVPLRAYVAQPFIVDGASMEPTFHGGDYLIIDELTYQFREPERGDVVVFRYPLNPSHFFIKRIIGLPGETVEIDNGLVFVSTDGNRAEAQEPYLSSAIETLPTLRIELGDGEFFVLGDNRPHSADSRIWGVLPRGNITGRALVRLLPLSSIDWLLDNENTSI